MDEARARLLDRLRGGRGGVSAAPEEPIPRRAGDEIRLSVSQERMAFLEQMRPGTAVHNLAAALSIEGPLDKAALRAAVRGIVARHDALRTAFSQTAEGLRPVPASPPDIEEASVADLPPADRRAAALGLANELAATALDLSRGPFRLCLIHLSDTRTQLVVVIHHLVFDGWSLGIFVRDFAELYEAAVRGRSPMLPSLRLRYSDYADWHRDRLDDSALKESLDYWAERLSGELPALELPRDRARPAVTGHSGEMARFPVPRQVVEDVREFARSEGVSMFAVLVAAYQLLLARWGRSRDVVVGSPVANRSRPELEDLIGLFINTVCLRTRIDPAESFRAFVHEVAATCLGALAHAQVPFEKVVEAVNPPRDLSRSPLFQAMIVYQNVPRPRLKLADLVLEAEPLETGTAKFDLTLFLEEPLGTRDDGLLGAFEYNTEIFDRARVDAMAESYVTLLRHALREPDTGVARIPLLDAPSDAPIPAHAVSRADPGPAVPGDEEPVESRFRRTAEAYPDAVACRDAERRWTYRELDAEVERIAAALRSSGCGPGAVAAVAVERDGRLPAAVLAVLRTGAAFLPIDPGHPEGRIRLLLDEAGCSAVVTTARHRALFDGRPAILLDDAAVRAAQAGPAAGPAAAGAAGPATADDPAYVIFTSGSTGKPKGVRVDHRRLSRFITAMQSVLRMRPGQTWLALTTVSFDPSIMEIILPLCCGGLIDMVPDGAVRDPAAIAGLLDERAPAFAQATPTMWRAVTEAGWQGSPDLGLLCGGEQMGAAQARELCARADRVWNVYGLTETTVWSTYAELDPATLTDRDAPVSVGRPLPGEHAYVVDESGAPAPPGMVGELWLGGIGAVDGYVNAPHLDAERFGPDPSEPGGLVCKTGDLAELRPDGTILLHGRGDDQIKLRGHRIELGEIEAVLRADPAVAEAAVVVQGEEDDRRLVAFVAPRRPDDPSGPSPLESCAAVLPPIMVPAAWRPVTDWPTTPSGKIDRAALQKIPVTGPDAPRPSRAPRNAREERLCALFASALDLPEVGIDDDFFALGGHSLLATRLISRVRDELGLHLDIRAFFDAPTVAGLAARAAKPVGRARPALVPRRADKERTP